MGSITHLHHGHQSHNSHHHTAHHHPTLLADYEGRHYVGSASQMYPSSAAAAASSSSMLTEADRYRANLSKAHAALHNAPSSRTTHTHTHSQSRDHEHGHGHGHNITARAMNGSSGVLYAQTAQQVQQPAPDQHAAYPPLQPPAIERLSSVNTYLTPPAADDARRDLVSSALSNTNRLSSPSHSSTSLSNAVSQAATRTTTSANTNTNTNTNTSNSDSAHRETISITEKDSLAMVVHSSEVPRCISPKGGSISDFTAEVCSPSPI